MNENHRIELAPSVPSIPTAPALSEKSPYQVSLEPTERAINASGRDGSPSRPPSDVVKTSR
jgi:hypothetical protein